MTDRRSLLLTLGLLPWTGLRAHVEHENWDVVVIGSGAAGLSAAAAASESGLRVLVLEKQGTVGGNTLHSGGFYAAIDPARQKRQGIKDSPELFEQQILENGGGKSDPKLVRLLVAGASDMLAYLEANGMRFKDRIIEIYGAHWPRCHLPVLPNGEGYIRTMLNIAMKNGAVIRTGMRATDLSTAKDGRIQVLVQSRREEILLTPRIGVILATGGFGANQALISRFAPRLAGLTNDNTPGSTGEILVAARKLGALLVDLEEVQCLPGRPPGGQRRVRLHNDVSRFIFVDHEGRRFVREDERRDVLRDKVLALPDKTAFSIVDDEGLRSYDILVQKETVLGVETGDAWRGDTVEELANAMRLPPKTLQETVEAYNRSVRSKIDPLGKNPRELRHEIKTPPFWGCYAAMTVHYTMGGVRISPKAQVLREDGTLIPGLWAAGEVTGGIHGVNRMGANGVNDALVFGRIAGLKCCGGCERLNVGVLGKNKTRCPCKDKHPPTAARRRMLHDR